MTDFALVPRWTTRVTAIANDGSAQGPSDAELREIVAVQFELLHRVVYRFLAYGCHDPRDAEDLTQETFIRFYRALEQGKQIQNPRRWLFTVARRAMIDHLEVRRNERAVELPADADQWIAGDMQTPEERLIQRASVARFHAAIRALAPLQRACFYLRGQGLRLREIGEILDRDPRRVADALQRATDTLRRRIAEERDFAAGTHLFASLAEGGLEEPRDE